MKLLALFIFQAFSPLTLNGEGDFLVRLASVPTGLSFLVRKPASVVFTDPFKISFLVRKPAGVVFTDPFKASFLVRKQKGEGSRFFNQPFLAKAKLNEGQGQKKPAPRRLNSGSLSSESKLKKTAVRQQSQPSGSSPSKPKLRKTAVYSSANKKAELKTCKLSGQSQRPLKDYIIKSIIGFSSDQISHLPEEPFSYIKKGWSSHQCPEHCEPVNDYKISYRIYPQKVNKGSCPKEEAKESYSIKKRFAFQTNQDSSVQKAHKNMTKWIVSIFVDPYYPAASHPKEFVENNLGQACPSCSFYLNYSYKYTKDNNIDFQITANCGDKRELFTSFKVESVLSNYWSCKLGEKPDGA